MAEIDNSNRTFFNPDISISGGTEHAMRFPRVYGIRTASGENAFCALSTNITPQQKLAAVAAIKTNILCLTDPAIPAGYKDDLLWEFFFAANRRYHYFAIQDVVPVATAMQDAIAHLFTAAANTSDSVINDSKKNLVSTFIGHARYHYSEDYPEARRVPNRRAISMLRRIYMIDPVIKECARQLG